MTTPEFSPKANCYPYCDLYSACVTAMQMKDAYSIGSLVEFDADEVMRQAEVDIRNADTLPAIDELRNSIIEGSADPAIIEEALNAIDGMSEDIAAMQFQSDITRFDTRGLIEEQERQSDVFAAAVQRREDSSCPGPQQKTIGRFFAKKTVTVCGLSDTPEFVEAQKVVDQRRELLRQNGFDFTE